MKIINLKKRLCIGRISSAISILITLLLCENRTMGIGAAMPFTEYEAENGVRGGGASPVYYSTPTDKYSSPMLEASQHIYVQLTGTGQYVQWTNTTGHPITAFNLRYCIPDATNGYGINSTIDLYVDGVFRQAFPVTSKQNYVYEGAIYGDRNNKNPAVGHPHKFWNEGHEFIPGAAVANGSVIRFQKDSANTATFYYIDLIDLEQPPAAIAQPANSYSIMDYGAVSNNPSVDNTMAIRTCSSNAFNAGKIVYIPPGTFYISAANHGLTMPAGQTMQGAGVWYTTLYRYRPTNYSGVEAGIIGSQSITVKDLSMDCDAYNSATNGNGVTMSGTNWLIDDVWMQHVGTAVWCSGKNGKLQNCRIMNVWGDGGNFNNVQDPSGVGINLTYSNNFVRGTCDDAAAINSVNYNVVNGTNHYYTTMSNITYVNNTLLLSEAHEMGVYGGINDTVSGNLIRDSLRLTGLAVSTFGSNGSDLESADVTGNVLWRCGGNGFNQQQAAVAIGGGTNPWIHDVNVSGNTINNSLFTAVNFQVVTNATFSDNVVNNPGLDGIAIGMPLFPAASGSAIIEGNTVTGVPTGRIAFTNYSTGFDATLVGNSWQSSGPTNGSIYHLICQRSYKALDNRGSTTTGTEVDQWADINGEINQEWQLVAVGGGYYNLVCQKSGMALDNGGSTTNGSVVTQWTVQSGNINQYWQINSVGGGYYHLICEKSGKALDNRGSTADGSAVGQWTDQGAGNPNQNWMLEFVR